VPDVRGKLTEFDREAGAAVFGLQPGIHQLVSDVRAFRQPYLAVPEGRCRPAVAGGALAFST